MDCGLLCGKRCCHGGDGDGMILFEGEEPQAKEFAITDMDVLGQNFRLLVCKGWCRRQTRPLSCRIYPLAPYLDKEGNLSIIPDPRASYRCPILPNDMAKVIDPRFYLAVEDVFQCLLNMEGFRPMLEVFSRMLDVYKRFTQREEH
jgi:hypothetical protein